MSHSTVTYKGAVEQRIDMRWLTEVMVAPIRNDDINERKLSIGNDQIEIGELFEIPGNFSNSHVVLENTTTKMDYVGAGLLGGFQVTANGDVGHYAGASLSGGNVKINGNTQDFTACGMSNGFLEVTGSVGDYIGSAYAGDKAGMSGGTVLVHKDANNFTGDLMRRGTIMVVGNIGDYCGSRMIAGTITNLGTIGKQVGVGMRRGTILLPHKPKDVITGFHDCGRHSLGYLTLLLHELRRYESTFQSLHPMRRRVQRYQGDAAVSGQGEMLIWIG